EFLPGQYLNVSFTVDGKTVRRSYTIASSPKQSDACELTVKREDQGVCSRHLHDAVGAGNVIEVSGPAGRFTFTGEGSNAVVLVAGGVGITPLMSKIRYLTDVGWPGEIQLVFAARTEQDVIFRRELDSLRERFPNLRVTLVLSREESPSWAGERGRITPKLLGRVVPALAEREVHVCGPTEMMDAVVKMLRGLGVPDTHIHLESFVRPAAAEPSAAAAPNGHAGPVSVTFARSGRSTSVPPGRTVLDASEELGVEIPSDCRVGVCGTCKTRLISGRVEMDVDAALDPADRAGNFILSCQARCVDEVVVEA
ncbi:MAG: FAD-binding oxidoreductase, partial [Isosphaeraceae bacterium]